MTGFEIGAVLGATGSLWVAFCQGKALIRRADADYLRASRCDPMNPNFHPVPPKRLLFPPKD
jgi:hypothetical protein